MSRQKKSLLNANINVIFYFLSAIIAFFSRKIFLENLGDDFMGLSGTLGNMLGLINMAELGIASAVGVSLYKPIFENDKKSINELLSVFGFLWKRIGLIVLVIAVIFSLFFPYFFSKTQFPLILIYALYFGFLTSSLFSYFFNYQQILLASDQRNYVITLFFSSSVLVKTILQMVLVIYFQSFYGWITLEVLFSAIYSIILNKKIKHDYPWLHTNTKIGKTLLPQYSFLWKKTKEIFAHKFGYVLLNQTDQILIYAFTSLSTVAQYGNYFLVITKIGSLFDVLFTGFNATIGSIIQENDHQKIKKVFWEINSFRFLMAGCLVIVLYFSMEPLIGFWVGEKYIMDKITLILILVNLFFLQIISTVELFKYAYGLFQDVWAPLVEAVINMFIAILLGYFYGIQGVLLGTAVSAFLIKIIWKPYFLYKHGFMEPVLDFWLIIAKYLIGFALTIIVINLFVPIFELNIRSLKGFIIHTFLITLISVIFYSLFLYFFDKGFRDFFGRMLGILTFYKK
ncbi:MAG: lipopolysaccharide biosynthesis protein [Lutibacter sp.]